MNSQFTHTLGKPEKTDKWRNVMISFDNGKINEFKNIIFVYIENKRIFLMNDINKDFLCGI